MSQSPSPPDFLAHNEGDSVAVAVRDLEPGPAEGAYLRGPASVTLTALDAIPLGHKVALADVEEGQEITEYGQRVGVATRSIAKGGYVHVHNVRSARWHSSVA
ncbi:MAG TPA: UxaA family hydrolase [Streptosporangiaceae bacterium]